ncbi:MAG: Hsp20/alpha crystallin family protein [Candidatus Shapirobacteria bacterium]|nr:Hsp20/alpha crystallin family protein [Candidatus Shapirobacteria bacterium]
MAIVKVDPWTRNFLRPFFDEEEVGFLENNSLTSYETENDFVVKANVAGVPASEVDISIDRGVVTIRAEHEETKEEKQTKRVVYREGRAAKYLYTTSIPCPVIGEKAQADVENGIVTVIIPKAPEAKPQKVKVKPQK